MSVAPFINSGLQRILIIDENSSQAELLRALLIGYFRKTEIIFSASSVEEAEKICKINQPSLIFIDGHSPCLQNEQIVNRINSESTDVVFTLDAKSPMIPAFRFSGTQFITKPFSIEDLVAVMERAATNNQLKNHTAPHQTHSLERLMLKSQEGVTCLDLDNIIRLESDSNYTHFFLITGEKITIPKTLKEYENLLASSHFFRTHQSHMVNLKMVKKFLKEDGGYALMDDGTHVLVSRRKKNDFLLALTA